MIDRIKGKLVEKRTQSLVLEIQGLCYEVIVPTSVLQRIEEAKDTEGLVCLKTHHYLQIGPATGMPFLIGFLNDIERDFFQQFIKVSGIGPRAAVKALNKPISEITKAIDAGDTKYLTTLPGIGLQRAKEIVAKLQGKVGKFGLIQDTHVTVEESAGTPDWQEEALTVLLQLQYKKSEAQAMIAQALKRSPGIKTAEDLLNEIYKQKVKSV